MTIDYKYADTCVAVSSAQGVVKIHFGAHEGRDSDKPEMMRTRVNQVLAMPVIGLAQLAVMIDDMRAKPEFENMVQDMKQKIQEMRSKSTEATE